MGRKFELKGSQDEKFKQIEALLPRISRRLNTHVKGIVPPVILHHYCAQPNEGIIFKGLLFEGKVTKVALGVDFIEGDQAPEYYCTIQRNDATQSVRFTSKKNSYVGDVDFDTIDGDRIEVGLVNPSVVIKDIYVAIQIQMKPDRASMIKIAHDELEATDEGI